MYSSIAGKIELTMHVGRIFYSWETVMKSGGQMTISFSFITDTTDTLLTDGSPISESSMHIYNINLEKSE